MAGYYRRRKRTGSKRKGFKKSKPRATMSTAMVKRLIRSEQETKYVDANLNFYLTTSELPSGISMQYKNEGVVEANYESHPHIASGAASYQRVGNKVFVEYMSIKWLLQNTANVGTVTVDHSLARILIVMYQDTSPNIGGVLDYADDLGGDSPVFAHYKGTATNAYKVLYDRTFVPRSTVAGGVGGTDVVTGGQSWYINKKIRIGKEITFSSNASQTPNGFPIVAYAFHNDGSYSMRGQTRFAFKDA